MGALFSSCIDRNERLQATLEFERRRQIQQQQEQTALELERRRQILQQQEQAALERRRQIQQQEDEERKRTLQRQIEQQQQQQLNRHFDQLTINAGTANRLRREEQLVQALPSNFEKYKVSINEHFIPYLRPWIYESFPNHDLSHNKVNVVTLDNYSSEYISVNKLFRMSNKNYIKTVQIERIDNIYLMAAYLLKKEQFRRRHFTAKEKIMFHGTKSQNVQGICNNNFNWRLRGTGTGHRFGKGVSFSPIAFYATHYSDKKSSIKKMLMVNIMYNNTCIGNKEMTLPASGCDTSTNDNKHVYVKYEDNEFYPSYIIHYSFSKNIQ